MTSRSEGPGFTLAVVAELSRIVFAEQLCDCDGPGGTDKQNSTFAKNPEGQACQW